MGIAALLILQLTMLKINGEKGLSPYGPGLNTFDLLATLLFIIEVATVGVMLLSLLAEPALERAWRQRFPERAFSRLAAGLSSTPVQFICAVVLLLPTLWIHRYPELSQAQGISIPLTLLQRWLLAFLSLQVATNLALILRWFTPLPRWANCALAFGGYWGFGYWLTLQSFVDDRFMRLNDVFFHNQLSRHLSGFPELMRLNVTLDIHRDFQGWFLALLGAAVLTTLLWVPRAALGDDSSGRRRARAARPESDKPAPGGDAAADGDAAHG